MLWWNHSSHMLGKDKLASLSEVFRYILDERDWLGIAGGEDGCPSCQCYVFR